MTVQAERRARRKTKLKWYILGPLLAVISLPLLLYLCSLLLGTRGSAVRLDGRTCYHLRLPRRYGRGCSGKRKREGRWSCRQALSRGASWRRRW